MKPMKFAVTLACFATLPLMQIAQAEILPKDTTQLTVTSQLNNQPSDASLQKLMQLMQFDKTVNEMNQQSKGMVDEAVRQAFTGNIPADKLSASQKQQLQTVVSDFAQKMLAEQNTPAMRQQLINAYLATAKATYTQAEVNAMIEFYGSPIGQAVTAKQSAFGTAYMQKIMPIMLDNQQKTMQKLMPELQQQLEKIVPTAKPSKHKVGKK